jgi:hypothetical protein
MPMPIEAGDIAARAILQGTASLWMLLGGSGLTGEAESAHADEHSTGTGQEVAPGKLTWVSDSLSSHG